jgi:hypothetical protein
MTGSLHTTLKLAEKYNMTLNMTKIMPKEDPPVNVSDSYLQGVTLIHNMMMSDKERECKLSELVGKDNKMEDSDKDKTGQCSTFSYIHSLASLMYLKNHN